MSQTVIVHFIFDISRDPMKPTNTRNYQTAQEALEVILKANNLGQSVKIDHNGDLFRAASPSNKLENFFLFFRKKSNSTDAKQSPEVLRTVINKMKIEIGIASTHLKNEESLRIPSPGKIINRYMKDAETLQTKVQISELHTQWILINQDINGAKDRMQSSMDRLGTSHYPKISKTIEKPTNTVQVTKKTDVVHSDRTSSPPRNITAKINEALPTSIEFSGDYSEPVVFALTLSENRQKEIFASLTDEPTFIPPEPKPDQAQKILTDKRLAQNSQKDFDHIEPYDEELEYDPFFDDNDLSDDNEISSKKITEISKQLWKDFGRAIFILIDQDDFQSVHGQGADPHAILQDLKSMVGDRGAISEKILKTLSHLPNQTTIGAFLAPIKLQNLTRSGNLLNHKFDETTESSIKKKETIYRIKQYANGDFECGFLKREKIEHIEHSDGSMLPVNSQLKRQGDVGPENFGYEISGKIKISEADLINGSLAKVKIIEPVRLRYHLQFDEPTT
jgi:hypothetical protein